MPVGHRELCVVVRVLVPGRRLDAWLMRVLAAGASGQRGDELVDLGTRWMRFFAPQVALYAINAALPHLRKRGGGRIVNISSFGGRVAVPHLVPYCASKFALAGLSDSLRAELAQDNIHVTTVCPGMMRTGSPCSLGL